MRTLFLFVFLLFFSPSVVFAGAAIEQQKLLERKKAAVQEERQKVLEQQAASRQPRLPSLQTFSAQSKKVTPAENDVSEESLMNLADIWRAFETSSSIWPDIVDEDVKILTIQKYVEWFRDQGVVIQKPPYQYVEIIDTIAWDNPDLLASSFKDVLMFVAIMEYDFNNGQDRDALARKILGEDMYQQNRLRLGLPR